MESAIPKPDSVSIFVACLMAGLLAVIAVTGHWPVDAPRTHVEKRGILSFPAEGITRVEFSAGEQQSLFSRGPREGWLFNGASTEPAVADHINAAARLLTLKSESYSLPEMRLTHRQMQVTFLLVEVLLPLTVMLFGAAIWRLRR
jgi:hypothetical protein